jgi:hypothetical protein
MSDNASSAELIVSAGMAKVRMASANDRQMGALRHESANHMESQMRFIQEKNLREVANMEIGRARNLSSIV